MSFVSIGDLSSAFRLRYFNTSLRQQANQLGLQLASGKVADPAKENRGNLAPLAAANRLLALGQSFNISATELDARATVAQSALQAIQGLTENASPAFQLASTSASNPSISSNASGAVGQLESILGALNSDIAGSFVFAGKATNTAPLPDAETLLTGLELATAGAATATDLTSAVDSFFASGGGYETSVYMGSDSLAEGVQVSPSDRIRLDVSAFDTEIREAIKGFATAALISRGALSGDISEQAIAMGTAGETLSRATSGLIGLQADIGQAQDRLETVQTRNQAQQSSYQILINHLSNADPYETATALQAVEGQLDALYLSTSRLAQLSLVRYLR